MRSHSFAILALFAATVVTVGLTACGNQNQQEMSDNEYADRMGEEHKEDTPVPGAATLEGAPAMEIEAETVTYATVDGSEIKGHLARPKGIEGSAGHHRHSRVVGTQ